MYVKAVSSGQSHSHFFGLEGNTCLHNLRKVLLADSELNMFLVGLQEFCRSSYFGANINQFQNILQFSTTDYHDEEML